MSVFDDDVLYPARPKHNPVNLNKVEAVNSPQHYNKGDIETIDVIMDVTKHVPGREGYLLGNTIKYLSRYHFKNGVEDLEKARWHVNKLIKVLQEDESNGNVDI